MKVGDLCQFKLTKHYLNDTDDNNGPWLVSGSHFPKSATITFDDIEDAPRINLAGSKLVNHVVELLDPDREFVYIPFLDLYTAYIPLKLL